MINQIGDNMLKEWEMRFPKYDDRQSRSRLEELFLAGSLFWGYESMQRIKGAKKRTDMYHFTYVRRFFAKSKQKPIFLLDMVGGTKIL